MTRIPRITYEGGFYHLYNRGHNKEKIFREDRDYDFLLSKIKKLIKQGDWIIYAYCLMPNHYHFLVEEKKDRIAKFIGRLFTGYSIYFNKKYRRQGTLFQDRFKSKIIQKENYFLTVSRYIHLNPYKSGITNDPMNYPYSSLREYNNDVIDKIIDFNKVTNLIGENKKSLDSYMNFISEGLTIYRKNGNLGDYEPFANENEPVGSLRFVTNRKMQRF